jgi:hypothetical protein
MLQTGWIEVSRSHPRGVATHVTGTVHRALLLERRRNFPPPRHYTEYTDSARFASSRRGYGAQTPSPDSFTLLAPLQTMIRWPCRAPSQSNRPSLTGTATLWPDSVCRPPRAPSTMGPYSISGNECSRPGRGTGSLTYDALGTNPTGTMRVGDPRRPCPGQHPSYGSCLTKQVAR